MWLSLQGQRGGPKGCVLPVGTVPLSHTLLSGQPLWTQQPESNQAVLLHHRARSEQGLLQSPKYSVISLAFHRLNQQYKYVVIGSI